jgi:hypothetical protein
MLASDGPDGDADIRVEEFPIPNKGNCQFELFMSHYGIGDAIEYDGTNGTESNGDIVRTGP